MFPESGSVEQNSNVWYLLASLKTLNSLTILVRPNPPLLSGFMHRFYLVGKKQGSTALCLNL